MCLAYGIPLLSGKDSMYVDGHLPGRYGEVHKVSALETMQFTTIGVIDDVAKCVTMESKIPGDLIYILGVTRDELGASEYYEHFGYIGLNVPHVDTEAFKKVYKALEEAIDRDLAASVHGIYRGGVGIHLAMVAMAGNLGIEVELSHLPREGVTRNDTALFSETPGRFIVTVDPAQSDLFEALFENLPCACMGRITEKPLFTLKGFDNRVIVSLSISDLKAAWKRPFGDLV
jgi:phosphoribosylformylglycinamidine synthase